MQKILIISQIPTHPATEGNRVHVKLFSTFLKQKEFEVFFLYLGSEILNAEMIEFWGDNLYVLQKQPSDQKVQRLFYYFRRMRQEAIKIKRYFQHRVGLTNKNQLRYNRETDDYFPRGIRAQIRALQKGQHFNIVICEYAALSKALTYFPKSTYKVLDTHDSFSDRFKIYLQNGLTPQWISLYKDQEKKALDRANLVIALQDEEREYFGNLSKTPAVRFFCMPEISQMPEKAFENKLMYFSSGNEVNLKTLLHFENKILPILKKKYPDVQLLVGGTICKTYRPVDKGIQLMGMYDKPGDFYRCGDIFINPELSGTGIKIKTLEALCFGIPVVCTKAGGSGLIAPYSGQFILADTFDEFAEAIDRLIRDPSLREDTSAKALQWVRGMKVKLSHDLLDKLPVNYKN